MNCKDFKEIADSYLSNELLVETNHEVLRHLENCANCRRELAARRELRTVLREAVRNASISQINPSFAFKLRRELRENALRKNRTWSFTGTRVAFASIFVILILAVAFGLIWRKSPIQSANLKPNDTIPTNTNTDKESLNVRQAVFATIRNDAIDDHKYCALNFSLKEKPISLEEAAEKYGKVNKDFDQAVIKPLREVFGDKAKFLEAHSCVVNGRRFAHVVIKYQDRVVSVLLTKRDDGNETNESDAILCQSADGLQTACFESGKYSVFVVSDLPESENLLVARTISSSVKNHIKQSGA
ncbi:hypothetical protein BH10ACI1_BH10ACI1_22990 [soil metagenome]